MNMHVNENFEREGCWCTLCISNHAVETIDEIEELLVKRCNVLREMKEEIRNLTDYHWLNSL